jgi:hypothetical protein
MDAGYISAITALAGSLVGGFASFATTWVTQHGQARNAQTAGDKSRRQKLYKEFIEEASRLYGDALERQDAQVSTLVGIYAMVSRMRVLSSKPVVEAAENVARMIIETYLAPNKSFQDLPEVLRTRTMDPLQLFSEACRDENAIH